jgi:peptidoglycan/LPS O-acetylase OafA/YrhL
MLAYKSLHGSAASDHLDLMRGGAAILVMLGHLRNLFLVSPAEVAGNAGVLVKFVYLISGFSHFAVMIFFALSGFLVGGSVIRGRMEGKWSWSAYFATRLTRLWIVLIPALLLGALWDHSGILAFGTSGIYSGQARADIGIAAVAPRLSASCMLGNALFLQGILTETFGSNGPLWSLSYEFWYYVLFPLMVLAYPAKKADRSTALYAITAVVVLFFVGSAISFYFLIWLLGAALNFAPYQNGPPAKHWYLIATIAVLLIAAAFSINTGIEEFRSDLAVGIASTVFILAVLRNNARSGSGLYSRAAHGLAGFSYTLYLVHLPALIFVSAWLVPGRRWHPDAFNVAKIAAIGSCALAYAFVIARLTEYRTGAVRARVIAAIDRKAENRSEAR